MDLMSSSIGQTQLQLDSGKYGKRMYRAGGSKFCRSSSRLESSNGIPTLPPNRNANLGCRRKAIWINHNSLGYKVQLYAGHSSSGTTGGSYSSSYRWAVQFSVNSPQGMMPLFTADFQIMMRRPKNMKARCYVSYLRKGRPTCCSFFVGKNQHVSFIVHHYENIHRHYFSH